MLFRLSARNKVFLMKMF